MWKMKAVDRSHPALRWTCSVVPEGEDVSAFVEHMFVVMRSWGGIGLAANQLAENKRIIAIKIGGFKIAIINPVITLVSNKKHTASEGCLSFGADTELKARYKAITVEGFDVNWKQVKFKLKKLHARCVQHEIDHLNGITIL